MIYLNYYQSLNLAPISGLCFQNHPFTNIKIQNFYLGALYFSINSFISFTMAGLPITTVHLSCSDPGERSKIRLRLQSIDAPPACSTIMEMGAHSYNSLSFPFGYLRAWIQKYATVKHNPVDIRYHTSYISKTQIEVRTMVNIPAHF